MLAHASNNVPSTEKNARSTSERDFRGESDTKTRPLDHRSGRPAVRQRTVEGSAGGLYGMR